MNGLKKVNASDYTASNGSTVSLTSSVGVGTVVELVAYKAFNVANPIGNTSGGDLLVGGDLTVTGTSNVGVVTGGTYYGDGSNLSGITDGVPGVSTTGHSIFNTIKASGITTMSATTASTSSSTGALIVSGGVGIAKSLFVGEGVSIAGTITYDDVTNIDSVGIVTAGKGLRATTGGLIVTAGVSTLSGGVDVSTTKPITLGTGTTIHQSASNSLVLGTNNKERVRIDSVGRIRIGTRATDNFGSNYNALQVHSESGANTYLALTNSTTGSNAVTAGFSLISVGVDAYVNNRSAGSITLSTTDTERVRIDKSGNVNMTGVCTATSFAGDGSSLTGTVNTGKAIAMAMIFG